ncbi:hypothetical protein BH10BAC2_BH10BAC2_06780 [soil metagenome]
MKPLLLFLFFAGSFAPEINAQFCSPDSSFGQNGIEVLKKTFSSEFTASSAIQNDGKIVVAVTVYSPDNRVSMFIVRYDINGKLDKNFGLNGKITPELNSYRAYAGAVSLMRDGKIIIAGYSYQPHGLNSNYDFTILRYNTDGSPDSSFGNNGVVITDFKNGTENEIASEMVLQPDGKLIVAGTSRDVGEAYGIYRTRFICVRYNTDGTLDSSFGEQGKQRFYFDVDQYDEEAEATSLALDSKGRVIIAGYNTSYTKGIEAAIVRCNTDGSPDITFGEQGIITTHIEGSDLYMRSVLIQPDQKIVLGGSITGKYMSNEKSILIRYNEDGTIDPGFGKEGMVMDNSVLVTNNCYSIALQTNNKIVAAGSTDNAFYLSRYDVNGSLDMSFGNNGYILSQMGLKGKSYVEKVNLFSNKIILAGYSYWNQDADLTIARYTNDLVLASTLQNFTATKKDNSALLQWQTKTENDTGFYAIQRSPDGIHFLQIGIVKSKDNSNQLQQYYFTDNNPVTGINYYRLKQTDADGHFIYASVVQVAFSKNITIKISPNPVQHVLTIEGLVATKDLFIIDASGKIAGKTISVDNTYNWNIQQLAAGVYYLVVQDNTKRLTAFKFVKQ